MDWQKGQRAVIDRRKIVTIDRVTPTGRVVVGDRNFSSEGYERLPPGAGRYATPARLEPLTAEIAAEMKAGMRSNTVRNEMFKALEYAQQWLRDNFQGFGRTKTSSEENIEKAEALVQEIKRALGVDTFE